MEFLKQSDEILSVGEFSRRFKMLIKTAVPELWLRGEVSNLKTYQSGHTYFTLKDEDASISAVLFKGNSRAVSFPLRDGVRILAFGEVSLYEQRGTYQMIVRAALQDGAGALAERFNALKEKLSKEGLFDVSKKKAIPKMPKNIAVITSPTGAAVRDFYRILKRRGWHGNIWIFPSRVQGVESAGEIVEQLKFAENYKLPDGSNFDVAILMRGGGSLEDLWSFNEEIVARAVAECRLPTISAVGHEIDFTLSDFAADLRAETPSAAAEHISSAFVELSSNLYDIYNAIQRQVDFRVSTLRDRLLSAEECLRLNSPKSRVANLHLRLDEISTRLDLRISNALHISRAELSKRIERFATYSPFRKLDVLKERVVSLEKQLNILGIENTLKRGYSLATDSNGKPVSAENLAKNDKFNLRFADGEISAIVDELK